MTRHHVELSHKDGKRQLLIDGVPLKGVKSTTVTVAANEPYPLVTVTFRPEDVIVTGEVEQVGRGKYDAATGLYEWYEDAPWTHAVKASKHSRVTRENGQTTEHPVLTGHLETECPNDCPHRKQ